MRIAQSIFIVLIAIVCYLIYIPESYYTTYSSPFHTRVRVSSYPYSYPYRRSHVDAEENEIMRGKVDCVVIKQWCYIRLPDPPTLPIPFPRIGDQ